MVYNLLKFSSFASLAEYIKCVHCMRCAVVGQQFTDFIICITYVYNVLQSGAKVSENANAL